MFRHLKPRHARGFLCLCASVDTEPGGKPSGFLVRIVTVMTLHTRCVMTSPGRRFESPAVGALARSASGLNLCLGIRSERLGVFFLSIFPPDIIH